MTQATATQTMTTGQMLTYTNRFNKIMSADLDDRKRNIKLAALMTDLEFAYDMPASNRWAFILANPHVMRLYQTVSESRTN